MRRIALAATVSAISAAVVAPAIAGTPSGQGAQKTGLSPRAGDTTSGQCQPGTGAQTNGFALLNTAGKVGSAVLTNGEVSLKGATPTTTYTAYIASNNSCTTSATLTTNTVGNGNAHLQVAPGLAGSGFYVVIRDANGNEAFASGPVTLQ